MLKPILYTDNNIQLEGMLALPPQIKNSLPTVILCHAWRGRDEFVCKKAEEMTQLGYAAFALDMYGKGVLGNSKEENATLMMPFINDRNFLLKRLMCALETVKAIPEVDHSRIAFLGFCFGGLCALDAARSGIDIRGAVSMHGLLKGKKEKPNKIKAKVLALHGYDDPLVPPDETDDFARDMSVAKADWQLHVFGQTKHAFTHPEANDPDFGTVYNPTSATRAWRIVKDFFNEIFD